MPFHLQFSSRPSPSRTFLILVTLLSLFGFLVRSTVAQGLVGDSDIVITSPKPGEVWTRGGERTIEWTGTRPESFSIGLVNRKMMNLVNSVAVANNVPTAQGKATVNLDSIPPGDAFQLMFYDNGDITKAYALSEDFSIKPDPLSTSASATGTQTGSSTTGTSTRTTLSGTSILAVTSAIPTPPSTIDTNTNAAPSLHRHIGTSTTLIVIVSLTSLFLGAATLLI